jgi:phosphatidylethanolamine/phosphatidyl-N-methylethanolamine N-methyltransferase
MPVNLLAQLLRTPAQTGAVAPSSRALARAMAEAADGAAALVELGAGTGPVTRALARRFPALPLTIVELQPAMARRLARAHPTATVHAQPAAAVLDAMDVETTPVVLVSSLPFRSLPTHIAAQTQLSIVHFLKRHPGAWLVQFTYHPRPPFAAAAGFAWRRVGSVFANIPPAGIWVLAPMPPGDATAADAAQVGRGLARANG